jgi:biopolymer transport protein ExbD
MKGKGSRKHRTSLVHHRPKAAPEVRSEINVTPLVDVCLVLLIIFMVVLPMLTRGKEVKLPQTLHHTEKKDVGGQPIVSITMDNAGQAHLWFDRDQVADLEALKTRVKDELTRKKEFPTIFVKADVGLAFNKDVYPVLIALHEAGSEGVELGSNEKKN